MKTIKLGLGAAAVAALAILLITEHRATNKLHQENQALQEQLAQSGDPGQENQRLSNLLAQASAPAALPEDQLRELLRLRGEAAVLRRQQGESQRTPAANPGLKAGSAAQASDAAPPPSPNYLSSESWSNVGYAEPDSGFRSFLGAAISGDAKTILDAMSPTKRAGWTNKSEKEITAQIGKIAGFGGCRILNREVVSDDEVLLTIRFETRDGTSKLPFKVQMKRIAGEWKFNDERTVD